MKALELPAHDGWHWGQRSGLVLEHGKPKRCRWCHGGLTGRRTKWCSEECVLKYQRVWNWRAMRCLIVARDEKTCQKCDTTEPPPPPKNKYGGYSYRRDPWDVDHIIRVTDGGTDDPDNLRLLCIPCHGKVGYEQRGSVREQPPEDDDCNLELWAGDE